MSELTVDQLLDLIEENGGPQGLNLNGKDLSGIALNFVIITRKRQERGWPKNGQEPPWYWPPTDGVNLSGAHLLQANLSGADLSGANLSGADLIRAKLSGADLSGADLSGAWISGANLSGAYLAEANLSGAELSGANLSGTDLRPVLSLKRTHWENAKLERTLIPMEKLGGAIGEEKDKDWEVARRAYHGLKVNWAAQGEYGYARWANRKERQMERKVDWQEQTRNILPRIWDSVTNWIDEQIWDYGQSPWRIMFWLVIMVLAGAGLYSVTNSLSSANSLSAIHWYDYLLFSLRTSVTLVFTEMGQTQGEWVKLLTAVQGVLGLIGYAAIIYTLGRRSAGF